jgi:tRNA A22 N-methylase
MNAAQQRFLLNRLDEVRRAKPSRYDAPKITEPKHVIAARLAQTKAKQVLEKWQKTIDRTKNTRNTAIDKAFNEAKTAILFSPSEDAIKAIDRFEAMKF